MKRDLNLVREILMRLEPLSATPDQPVPLDVGKEPLDIPGYTGQACCHPRAVALFRSDLRPARCRARRDGAEHDRGRAGADHGGGTAGALAK